MRSLHALVRHHRDGDESVELGEDLELLTGCGLLDQFDAAVDEAGHVLQRGEPVPAGVDVDADAGLALQSLRDLDHPGSVDGGIERTHLQLETEVPLRLDEIEGLLDDLLGGCGAEGPRDVDTLSEGAAEQRVYGHTQASGPGVVQRDVDGGFRETCIGDDSFDVRHDAGDLVDTTPQQNRDYIPLDDRLHRLHRFAAPPRPPGGTTPSP